MSNSIGTLTIDLAANVARLQTDMADAKRAVGGAMQGISATVDVAKKALIGLGLAVSVGSFVGIVKGALDSTAALDDLSKQTGISASNLSALAAVGRTTGTTAESIAQMMGRLAKGMAGADEESKGVGQAIKALGLNFDDFKKLSPDQQMLAIAKSMDQFADGAGKSAVAQALLGKEGAKAIPFLKDLAETGKLQAEATDEQSAAADEFLDNLTKLKAAGEGWSRELANGMAPALAETSRAFLDVFNGSGGLREEIQRLSKDGTIAEWTRMTVTGLTYVMDAVTGVWRLFRSLGEYIGGSVAAWGVAFSALGGAATKAFSGDFKGALAEARTGMDQWNQITGEMGENISKIWSEKTMGQNIRARMEEIKKLGGATKEAAKQQLDYGGATDKATKATKGQTDAIKDLTKVEDIEIAILKALKKEHEDALTLAKKETESVRDQVEKQREANDAMRYSTEVLAELEIQKLQDAATTAERNALLADETLINGDIAQQYREQAVGLRELAALKAEGIHLQAAKDSAAEWQKTSDSIFNSLTDALMRAFESGKGFGQALIDTLRNAFKTLVLQPTIQAIMAPVAGAMGGLMGGTAMAGTGGLLGGLGAGGGLLSGLGAIGGSLGMLGSGLSYGLAAYGGSATIAGTLSGAGAMLGAGSMGTALAGVGAIAGVALPAVIGALVLKKLLGRGKKKTTETGLVGDVIGGDFEGQMYADWKQSGGLLHKKRTGTNFSAVTDELGGALDEGGAAIFSQVSDYARALKLPADALAAVNYQIKVKLTGDEAVDQKAIEAAFAGYRDTLAGQFEAALEPFREAGESVADTLQRLSEVQVFSEALNEFGGIFSSVAGLSLRAKEELIGFAGGIEAFVAKTQSFVENYYSDAEKYGIGARQIQEQLAALGITGDISSRADLRRIIEGTDISTTEGRQQLDALLSLAQAFAPIAQYLEKNGGSLTDLAAQAPDTGVLQSVLEDQEILAEYQQRTANGVDAINNSVLSIGERISASIAAGNADIIAALVAIAQSTQQTARQLDKWDDNGAIVTTPGT